jgi:hypothetical protein
VHEPSRKSARATDAAAAAGGASGKYAEGSDSDASFGGAMQIVALNTLQHCLNPCSCVECRRLPHDDLSISRWALLYGGDEGGSGSDNEGSVTDSEVAAMTCAACQEGDDDQKIILCDECDSGKVLNSCSYCASVPPVECCSFFAQHTIDKPNVPLGTKQYAPLTPKELCIDTMELCLDPDPTHRLPHVLLEAQAPFSPSRQLVLPCLYGQDRRAGSQGARCGPGGAMQLHTGVERAWETFCLARQ